MAVELEIRDGVPWWMSADVWIVPGHDPQGAPGMPVAGQPNYLWAHVSNNGTSSVTNATVRFYWADPSTGFDRTTANRIGVAFVNLAPGEGADVLCLTPWVPVFVNQGHECVLAEAYHETLDPLPLTPTFNVPTDRHVAQRNLQVVVAVQGFFHLPVTIYNTSRQARTFQLKAFQGRVKDLHVLQPRLGFKLPETDGKLEKVGFVNSICPRAEELAGMAAEGITLEVPGHSAVAKTLVGKQSGQATVVHLAHYVDREQVGGLTLLVVAAPEGAAPPFPHGYDQQGGHQ